MEVAIPTPSLDFDFSEARPMAYLSAPSTPKRFGDYSFLSAPSSPSRVAELYAYFNDMSREEEEEERISLATRVPFGWEEKPGTPKSPKARAAADTNTKEEEFAFDFSLGKTSLSTADELFDGGKIKPLKPPPGLKLDLQDESLRNPLLSPRSSSPRSPIAKGKRIIKEAFSPRRRKDPELLGATQKGEGIERGRERVSGGMRSASRRGTRSLSPFRVSGYQWEDEEEEVAKQQTTKQPTLDSKASVSSTSSSKSSSRKWKLKDLLLFRSASEGRSYDKDPLRKYSAITFFRSKKHPTDQDAKNSSFRSTDGTGSATKPTRRKAPVSAHELHYTTNKAASEDLKKKTFLPYKHGLLGRLAFNPAVHAFSY